MLVVPEARVGYACQPPRVKTIQPTTHAAIALEFVFILNYF